MSGFPDPAQRGQTADLRERRDGRDHVTPQRQRRADVPQHRAAHCCCG